MHNETDVDDFHREIDAGDFQIVLNLNRRYAGRDPSEVMGYSVSGRIKRFDGKPVVGNFLVEAAQDMISPNGPFATRELALAAGEAWARHYISQLPTDTRDQSA